LIPSYVSVSFKDLLRQQIYYWTITENVYDAVHGWPLNVVLIQCWSLACEMQFYLLWPFFIYFFGHREKWLVILLVIFFITALLLRVNGKLFLPLNGIYPYVLLPCRLDAFSGGALLYLFFRQHKTVRHKKELLFIALTALGIILVLMAAKQTAWHYSVDSVKKYGYTLDAIFWTALMGFTLSTGPHFWKYIFTGRVMTGLGKYSYGIYIFHWPLYIIIARQQLFNTGVADKTLPLAAAAFAATFLCSFASYQLLEKRFLKLKPPR
jgi:peptidoglycan/LPS O-acetylase OafA/YrhL